MPDYKKYLRTFGEIAVLIGITTVTEKQEDRGKTWMFLGYEQNHTRGTYRILNIHTNCIVLSREIIWLNKTYGEYVSRKWNTKADSYILKY